MLRLLYPWIKIFVSVMHCCQVHTYPWSATAPSHTQSCSCRNAMYTHILGQPQHLLILNPVPAGMPCTLISLVSHSTFSYSILFLQECHVHSYPRSATAPSHTQSCSCRNAMYTHILGQPQHLLILNPVPAGMPCTLISLVSHSTFSYSILFLQECHVHSYPWSATAPSHTQSCSCRNAMYTHILGQPQHLLILNPVPARLPCTLISSVSHSTFSYSILFLQECHVHSYPRSATAPSHTQSCSCRNAMYTHILGQPQHLLILYSVSCSCHEHSYSSLVNHSTFSYTILFLHDCHVHSYPWSATAPSHTQSCSCRNAMYTHILGQPQHLLILNPVPAGMPCTLISLVSHSTFSYSILFLQECHVHSYPWSATAPSHTLFCVLFLP